LFAAAFTADPEDAELRAMDQYIELCEQLPAYECEIFRLKQVSKKRKVEVAFCIASCSCQLLLAS
jgi:hypothetical protein